jgi:F-type H+-transporting ATPase subunit alpha
VPVGEELLGRVIDPMGRPLDERGAITAARFEPVERPAPEIIDRAPVIEPLQTGILSIDAMFALGRGQRELIIGDRATGKTTLAVDTIINQRRSDVLCVYVAVGAKTSEVAQILAAVRTHGAFERCLFVVAEASSVPGLQWIAPAAAFTMAEFFRDRGQHALVVIDDLTKHAATHRELSLLLRQSPGREAYPGDIFYLHARLLERAAKLNEARGGGSLTALPIAETQAGNLSAYIPTNLISITDGQIYLDTKLFNEGRKPAIDVGLSVSRVGGKTQAPALRQAVESLRLEYTQFLELELFTRFGAMVDERTRRTIARGRRIRTVLGQPQLAPLRLGVEVALLLAVTEGVLDTVPEERAITFKTQLPDWLEQRARTVMERVEVDGTLPTEHREALLAAVKALATTLSGGA